MNIHDYRFLLSERGALNKMISRSPESDVIGRIGLEHRLKKVEAELQAYEGYSPRLINAYLTFRGKPVVGSRGVLADFGSDAVKAFANAVTQVGASQRGPLPGSGPIPGCEDYQLLITGGAPGSFGFRFEDAAQKPAPAGQTTPVERAIERVKSILEASVGTDEQFAEAIDGADKRALRAVSAFLKTVADSDAVCSLEFNGDVFSFRDTAQVKNSMDRLSACCEVR